MCDLGSATDICIMNNDTYIMLSYKKMIYVSLFMIYISNTMIYISLKMIHISVVMIYIYHGYDICIVRSWMYHVGIPTSRYIEIKIFLIDIYIGDDDICIVSMIYIS